MPTMDEAQWVQMFWVLASLEIALSVRLALRMRTLTSRNAKPIHPRLVNGQRKDNWVVSIVIWLVLPSADWPIRSVLVAASIVVMAWMLGRTLRRWRLV